MKIQMLTIGFAVVFFGAAEASNAPDLVRQVRSRELWAETVGSLWIRLEGRQIITPQAIEPRQDGLREPLPDHDASPDAPSSQHSDVDLVHMIAFDADRAYRLDFNNRLGDSTTTIRWDGQTLLAHTMLPGGKEHYVLDDDPWLWLGRTFRNGLWLSSAQRPIWTDPREPDALIRFAGGPADGFVMVGRENFEGVSCWILDNRGQLSAGGQVGIDPGLVCWERWYVGVNDGHLYARIRLTLPKDHQAIQLQQMKRIAQQHDQTVATESDWVAWMQRLDERKRMTASTELVQSLRAFAQPDSIFRTSDWREVIPGGWCPMRQSLAVYDETEDGRRYERYRNMFEVIELRINEPLPEDLFEHEMKAGITVLDERHDVPLSYEHDPDRTESQWRAMLDASRRLLSGAGEESER